MTGNGHGSWSLLDIGDNFYEFGRRETLGTSGGFADAVTVWINKPHVVNRRLCGSKILFHAIVEQDTVKEKWELITHAVVNNDLSVFRTKSTGNRPHSEELLEVPSLAVLQDGECMIVVRDVLPKNTRKHPSVREAVLFDFTKCSVWFCPILNIFPKDLQQDTTSKDLNGTTDGIDTDTITNNNSTAVSTETHHVLTSGLTDGSKAIGSDVSPKTNKEELTQVSKEHENISKPECVTSESLESNYKLVYKRENENSVISLHMPKVKKEETDAEKLTQKLDWLRDHLLTKIANWSQESQLKTSITSLRLVPVDSYNTLYNELKDKYGKRFVEIWPEKTDPQKFVYEDVAIATYLLVLWQNERAEKNLMKKQSFVDLGCGNGLLVHILQSEGHCGLGLDVRRRNIWDLYGEQTILKEEVVTPSADSLFPEYDWIIGNHSDELTPWIPVIAARSSYNCSYFVLPCCHFDFDKKFSQRGSGVSNYRAYLDFVKDVGDTCGFRVQEDTLRIPSTKRVCFIGSRRTYSEDKELEADKRRTDYITSRCSQAEQGRGDDSNSDLMGSEVLGDAGGPSDAKRQKVADGQWSVNFQPRESTERSRNCKNVKKEIKEHIIHTVFTKLLEVDKTEVRELADGRKWRKGGVMSLAEVVSLFDGATLKELKSECGGLQTLLRNHNSVFNVSGGKVQLRDLTLDNPYSQRSKLSKSDKSQYFKTMLCWFFKNHPDGCPRTSETCTFAHGEEDQLVLSKTNAR